MAATKLIEYLGGIEKLREEAPLVLEYLQKSVSQPLAESYYISCCENPAKDAAGLYDDSEFVFLGVEEIYPDKNGIHSFMRAGFGGEQHVVDIVAELYNVTKDYKMDEQSRHFYNTAFAEFDMFTDHQDVMESVGDVFRVEAEFTWSADGETSISQKVKLEVDEYDGEKPIISQINVGKPRAKNHMRTEVLYDRVPLITEDTDYHYENVVIDKGKATKVMMPFAGEITVEKGFQIKGIFTSSASEQPELSLLLEKGGGVVYSNEKSFAEQCVISGDKGSLTWEIKDDWNKILDLEHFSIETILDFSCVFTLMVQHPDEPKKIFMPKIMINSVDSPHPYVQNSGVLEIEKIHLKWGCLAEDTMIGIADGGSKQISSIKIGDMVRTQSGCTKVVNIIMSVNGEDELVHLETDNGHILRMTRSHPVKTKRGFISADKLTAADVVETVDGDSVIKYLYTEKYGKDVYNLELEESDAIICNGIIAGDFKMQNTIQNRKKSVKLSKLQLEFEKIYQRLK